LAGVNATTSSYNTIIGHNAGTNLVNGSQNVIIGQSAADLPPNTLNGSNNTIIGQNAGDNLTGASSNNILIGQGAGPNAAGVVSNTIWASKTIAQVATTGTSYYILAYDPSTGRIVPLATGSKVAAVPTLGP
jgi:hypothetical protein